MNKEEKELRKHLELQTKEELIEQIIILTRTYENALNTIVDKKDRIDKAIEYVNEFENIKAYYSWIEDGYEEYNYDENFKEQLLDILRGENNEQ